MHVRQDAGLWGAPCPPRWYAAHIVRGERDPHMVAGGGGVSLMLQPITLREANAFVAAHHRHHKPTVGHILSVAVSDGETVHGVAIVGRPLARMLEDGWTAEVLRCCTDGARNACSMLYGASWRAVRALGYRRLVTYTLPAEGGASLRAAGWRCIGQAGGGSWSRSGRPRVDTHPTQEKLRWEAA